MTRLLSTLSLVALIAAAGRFLLAAGWIPWAAPVAVAALALIIAGFAFRRRRTHRPQRGQQQATS